MRFNVFRRFPQNHRTNTRRRIDIEWSFQQLEPRLLLHGSQIHLADLLSDNGGDGTSGFVATGIDTGDQAGTSARAAGDINGDGVEDLIIGAPSAGAAAGEIYVVYGTADGFSAAVDLAGLDGTNGLRLVGASAEQAGFSVSSAGDVNNDNFDDLIIGAPASDPSFSAAATSCDAGNTVGLNTCDAGTAPGFTLFAPNSSTNTYLIDNDGLLVNSWSSPNRPALSSYLLDDGSLLRTGTIANQNATFNGGGSGGQIEIQDWDGNQTWLYEYSSDTGTDQYLQHHDVERLPNGNVLVIAWELKTQAEAEAAGRDPALIAKGELWPDKIIEVQQTGATTGNIVWEWNVWDHLIQDFDNTKANFGVVADNPQLVDINYTVNSNSDWLHTNGIDYNASLDQIVLSVRNISEIWVIDHSTTTAQAATHTGGTSGRGGDLLYRWGNPQTYDAGVVTDQKLFVQHDARWVETGQPGAGNIMIFNNGQGRPGGNASSVEEITPPLNIGNNNNYDLTPGLAYGPATTVFTYPTPLDADFFSQNISGAHRLPNGNTLITNGPAGEFREIDSSGSIVWDYISPVTNNGILDQGDPPAQNLVFRATKYDPSFPGFIGKDLAPGGVIEGNSGGGGTSTGRADAGAAYVVFGGANLPATISLSGLNGTSGFVLNGASTGDGAGTSVAGAGDVNNDGWDDVLVGAPGADPSGRVGAGSAYVVFGAASFSATIELSGLNGSDGFQLDGGASGDEFGISVSSAGDVNNDDFDDLLIGAPAADAGGESAAGSAYVVFGAADFSGPMNVTTLNGASGFRLDGVDENDRAGQSVAGEGDVNGDGYSDVIIGSPRAEVDGVSVGAAYVFFGKASDFSSSVALSSLDGSTGFRLAGDYESDPLLNSFIVNTTGLKSHDIAGQNTSLVENSLVNFTSVIPDDNSVYAHSSGIPAEVVGTWAGNPNTVTDQDRTHQIPRSPSEETNTKTETRLGSTGVWIDGVAIFNWSDARSYRNRGVWNQNAVYFEGPSLDGCGAHPPPFGEYHTHATPACLMERVGDDGSKHSPILGWSYDGFPIYGPWGFANVDGTGNVGRMESSWQIRNITQRTHYADGSNVLNGPAVAITPLGAYLEDHEYENNQGDLDRYNGRFSVTPEYPQGVYHYHVTTDADGDGVFPYVIGVEYYGSVETANTIGAGRNVGDPAAADIYVSYIRDHNGDGLDDPALGDPDGYVSGSNVAGTAHVFYGKSSGFAADTHLHTLDGTNGFHVEGIDHHDHAGHGVAAADLNGDGTGDLIIGAHDSDVNGHSAAGQTFVVFGSQSNEYFDEGDINGDGVVNADDIDLMNDHINSDVFTSRDDLNGDSFVDTDDRDILVRDILGTEYGDGDLDQDVDTRDITSAIINYTGASGMGNSWATGDVDGDGDTDSADLTRMIINFTGARAVTLARTLVAEDFDGTAESNSGGHVEQSSAAPTAVLASSAPTNELDSDYGEVVNHLCEQLGRDDDFELGSKRTRSQVDQLDALLGTALK